MRHHAAPDFVLELQGYRLTTAEIIYFLPDYPELLQTFIWQNLDIFPDFPRLHSFLIFWQKRIEGCLFSVAVAQADSFGSSQTRFAKEEFKLH